MQTVITVNHDLFAIPLLSSLTCRTSATPIRYVIALLSVPINMTANSQEYVNYVMERLSSIPKLSSGRFFGGTGIHQNAVQFAMIMGNSLYLVVDQTTRGQYENMGSKCFSYKTRKGHINVKKYFEVPAEILENEEQLVEWAEQSIRTAHRLKAASRPHKR